MRGELRREVSVDRKRDGSVLAAGLHGLDAGRIVHSLRVEVRLDGRLIGGRELALGLKLAGFVEPAILEHGIPVRLGGVAEGKRLLQVLVESRLHAIERAARKGRLCGQRSAAADDKQTDK